MDIDRVAFFFYREFFQTSKSRNGSDSNFEWKIRNKETLNLS